MDGAIVFDVYGLCSLRPFKYFLLCSISFRVATDDDGDFNLDEFYEIAQQTPCPYDYVVRYCGTFGNIEGWNLIHLLV